MNLLICPTEAAARLLERKAYRYAIDVLGCKGGNWSDIYANPDGTFGILWDNSIAGAFTKAELGAVDTVKSGQTTTAFNQLKPFAPVVTSSKGVVTGTWTKVPEPIPLDILRK